jgi:ADP-heptose:LPS heptosyltransferase
MNNRIASGFGDRMINLTGKTEIKDLLALFQMTDIVVGADTGPLHLAAAVGKSKVLGIFGSTPVKRNGPYGANSATLSLNLECQPCFQKECPLGTLACLHELSPNVAFEQVMRLVNQKPGFL